VWVALRLPGPPHGLAALPREPRGPYSHPREATHPHPPRGPCRWQTRERDSQDEQEQQDEQTTTSGADSLRTGGPPLPFLDRPLGGRPPITLNPRWLCSQTNRLTRNEPRLGEARRPRPHITDGCYALPIDRRKRPRATAPRRHRSRDPRRVSPVGPAVRPRRSAPCGRAATPTGERAHRHLDARGQVLVSVIGALPTHRATRPEGAKPTPVLQVGGSGPNIRSCR
jgi:hypothetical protein